MAIGPEGPQCAESGPPGAFGASGSASMSAAIEPSEWLLVFSGHLLGLVFVCLTL